MARNHQHAPGIDPETGHRRGCTCTPCAAHAAGMTIEEYRGYVRGLREATKTVVVSQENADAFSVEALSTEAPAAPAAPAASAPASTPTACWRKVDDTWCIEITDSTVVTFGEIITITRRDGSTADVTVGEYVGTGYNDSRIFRPGPAVAPRTTDDAPRAAGTDLRRPGMSNVPSGNYAVRSRTGNNDLDFFHVRNVDEGNQWAGWTFVDRVIGGHDNQRIRKDEQNWALQAIADAGPFEAGALFGQELHHCGKCGRHLTKRISRTRGYGPKCWGDVGGDPAGYYTGDPSDFDEIDDES